MADGIRSFLVDAKYLAITSNQNIAVVWLTARGNKASAAMVPTHFLRNVSFSAPDELNAWAVYRDLFNYIMSVSDKKLRYKICVHIEDTKFEATRYVFTIVLSLWQLTADRGACQILERNDYFNNQSRRFVTLRVVVVRCFTAYRGVGLVNAFAHSSRQVKSHLIHY